MPVVCHLALSRRAIAYSCALLVSLAGVRTGFAQAERPEAPVIYVGPGSSLTIGPGSHVTVPGGDVHIAEGALLVNDGTLDIGRDLIVDGALQTTLGGSDADPRHGRIYVAGDAEYRGSLSVALARGASFREPQDFTLVTFAAGFGQLAARQLPGARWRAQHRERELVVSIAGPSAEAPERFAIEIDAAPLDSLVVVDWVVWADTRTHWYAVERYDAALGWLELGRLDRIQGDIEAAYYSSVDNDLPAGEDIVRYRVRLVDESGAWRYSEEVAVYIGREQPLRVFPNPVAGTQARVLGLDTRRTLTGLRLVAMDGRTLQTYAPDPSELYVLELPAAAAAGTYVIEAMYADGFRQNASLVVIR